MSDVSDWSLIQRCRRGDETAFQVILDRYERLIFAIVRRYGLTSEDAVDVSQQTFMQMFSQLEQFHAESNLKGWLGTVARRNAWRLLNRYDHEQVEPPEDVVELADLLGLQQPEERTDTFVLEWLDAGVRSLGERCEQLVQALYFERETPSYDELAERFGIAKGSIGPTRKRCLSKLKKELDKLSALR